MSNIIHYKGYIGKIEVDLDSNSLYGSVVNTRDIITFSGNNVEGIQQAFIDSVDDYLTWAEEDGFIPEKPFSGKIILRMPPELHREIASAAIEENMSINKWIINALQTNIDTSKNAMIGSPVNIHRNVVLTTNVRNPTGYKSIK